MTPLQTCSAGAAARLAVLLAAVLTLAGCQEKDVRTVYGSRSGYGANSVNGTWVLGEMLEDAGHRVRSWRLMSPSLAKADVIVYFPTESQPLSADAEVWLDDWLRYSYDDSTYEYQSKALIIVGRVYDAEAYYWSEVQAKAPAGLGGAYASKLRSARNNAVTGPAGPQAGTVDAWYDLANPAASATPVKRLTGPWAAGVNAAESSVEHYQSVTPHDELGVLLADGGGHPLVAELNLGDEDLGYETAASRVLVVENGSFLLNAPLVNHENRKLAGRLVDWVGEPRQDIVFLEADHEPTVSESDPSQTPPTGLGLFRIWPIGAVLAQLAALGLVFALAQFPIFGVPRRLDRPSLTDFGNHVSALSHLLAATRDPAYASSLVRRYFSERR